MKVPEKERPVTDRFALLAQALYDHAMNDDVRLDDDLAELFDDMGFEDLGHQVREGVRDAEKRDGNVIAPVWVNEWADVSPELKKAMSEKILSPTNSVFRQFFNGADYAKERDRTVFYTWPRQEGKTEVAWRSREYGVAPPADDTPSSEALQGWSEEEIDTVRRSQNACGYSYSKLADWYLRVANSSGHISNFNYRRLAAIAEHLAKMEG